MSLTECISICNYCGETMYSAKTIVLTFYLLVTALFAQMAQSKELMLLTWPDYIDPQVLLEFKKRTGITVKQSFFDSDTNRDALLLETECKGFDIALINDASIRVLAQRGCLEPLEQTSIPNLKHVDPRKHSEPEQTKYFGVPYFWGTVGIVYRKDLVPFTVSSWMDLLQPQEVLHEKIAMIGDSRDLIGMALKALGYSLNSTDDEELKQAEVLLQAQAPAVQTYRYLSLKKDSTLLTGKVIMSMMYNGDALVLKKHDKRITFVLPQEGSNIWVDYLSVLSSSPNKAEAKQFINFLNEPQIAAQLAQYVNYASPNQAAEKLLPKAFRDNPIIYPNAQALENSEAYQRLNPNAQKKRTVIFSRIIY